MSWIQTYSGVKFDLLAPTPSMVEPRDIARALAYQCRFNGHVRSFYSVAQHSVLVSDQLPLDLMLAGLLHDAAEAYIGDMVRPLKRALASNVHREIEERVEKAIAERFQIDADLFSDPAVREADNRMLITERLAILTTPPVDWHEDQHAVEPYQIRINPWGPGEAEAYFMVRLRRFGFGM